MPYWYYDKTELRNTPSKKDGIDYDLECQFRKEGARFIIDAGDKMDLGYNTKATGVVYFHRFFMTHSFVTFPKYLTACCALFLAGKVEETPKKAKDFIKMAEECLPPAEFFKFGENPKEELLILERILLQSIKFDLQVDHPYAFLLKYAKSLEAVTSERQKVQDILQVAWTLVNDSLCTTLCLQWEPEVIAVAMLYLAARFKRYDLNSWVGKTANKTRWWEMFVNGVTLDLLQDIGHEALNLLENQESNNTNTNTIQSSNTNKNCIKEENCSSSTSPSSAVYSVPPPNFQTNTAAHDRNKSNASTNPPTPSIPLSSTVYSVPPPNFSMNAASATHVGNNFNIYTNPSTQSVILPSTVYSVPPPNFSMNTAAYDGNNPNIYTNPPTHHQFSAIPSHYSAYGSYPNF